MIGASQRNGNGFKITNVGLKLPNDFFFDHENVRFKITNVGLKFDIYFDILCENRSFKFTNVGLKLASICPFFLNSSLF